MNIVLVRPDGIGDEILSLPVATQLRRLMPGARVTFLSSAYAAPVLAHHPDLDEVLTVAAHEPFGNLVRVFKRGFDAAIFLKPFRRLMAAAWLARVPVRVGTGYRWYSWLLNRRVYEHRSDFSRHESAYNVGLLRGMGLSPGDVLPPHVIVTSAERTWAQDFLGHSHRIIIHPGGFSSRLWKPSNFRDLILRLVEEGREVLLTGSREEGARFQAETEVPRWPEGVQDLMGLLTLRELMAVMAESRVVVSLATGPMHLAAALGIPTVSLFDPRRNNSPARWQPLGKGTILMPDVPTCEKCIYEACPYWDCLDRITVESVVARVRALVDQNSVGPLMVARV